jgi:hypothetical protein
MLGWFRKKTSEPTADEFHGIMVTLLVGGEQALFIMLGLDGSINRVGTGAVDNTERDMFIGRGDPAIFRSLQQQITPELLAWCGQSRADPDPHGPVCELTVGFKRSNGEEEVIVWRYGAESMGPPEVTRFVVAAVVITDPWFTEQKAMVRHNNG